MHNVWVYELYLSASPLKIRTFAYLFSSVISNTLWWLQSTDHFPVLLWGSGLSAVSALCPFPHLEVRHAVLINYFPSFRGISFRPKKKAMVLSQELERFLASASGPCQVNVTISLPKGGKVGFPGHLTCPWNADQLRYQHSLFTTRVFISVCLGCVTWVSWHGGRCRVEAVIIVSPLSPPSLLEWHVFYLSPQKTCF